MHTDVVITVSWSRDCPWRVETLRQKESAVADQERIDNDLRQLSLELIQARKTQAGIEWRIGKGRPVTDREAQEAQDRIDFLEATIERLRNRGFRSCR